MIRSKLSSITSENLAEFLLFGLAILPACVLGWLILKYSVNVPFYDQWATPGILFENIHNGTASFQDFSAQHNESRLLFPRLFFLGLAYLTGWNVRYEMLGIFATACVISASIYFLSRMTVSVGRLAGLSLLIPVNMLIFSPAQWENWLWGHQIVIFAPVLCLFLSLVTAYSKLAPVTKVILCIFVSILSTYSFANGMLCWFTSLAVLLLLEKEFLLNHGKKWLAFYVSICILVISTYFYDYHKPESHPSLAEAFIHPIQALAYFTAFLGSPLSGGNLGVAIVTGTIAVTLFCLLSTYSLVSFKRSSRLVHASYGWIIIGLYALASASITTLGRVGFGAQQSLSPRYTTFSVLLYISIIYLIAVFVSNLTSQKSPVETTQTFGIDTKIVLTNLLSCFITMTVVLHLTAFPPAIQAMQTTMRDRLYLKACLTYVHFSDDACKLKLFPDVPTLEKRADAINGMGFLTPKLAESSVVKQAKTSKKVPQDENGWFDQLSPTGSNQYAGGGWATLPNQKRSADAILLTYKGVEASEGGWRLFAVAPVQKQRDDVVKVYSQPSYAISGWETSFSTKALPKGKIRLRAWAYDSETGEAFRLKTTHLIQN